MFLRAPGSMLISDTRTLPAMAPSRRDRLWTCIARSSAWRIAPWWYAALLSIALVSKYLETGWGPPPGTTTTYGHWGTAHRVAGFAHRVFAVYRSDVVEAAVIVLVLAIVASFVPRVRVSTVAWLSIALASFVALAEWLAVSQTGELLSYANLMVSIDWAWAHPDVIPAVLSWKGVAAVSTSAVAYGALPTAITRTFSSRGLMPRLLRDARRWLGASSLTVLAMAIVLPGRVVPDFSPKMGATEGFWSSSIVALVDLDRESPDNLPPQDRATLLADYRRIAFPFGRGPTPDLIDTTIAPRRLRHVVLIVLETAPRKFYDITDDTTYPTFSAMRAHAIVTDHHFTTRPATLFAIYSMLTGTYPRPGSPIGEYGAFRDDGLAATLGRHGYESTYIDSYRVDWGYHYRAELVAHGFDRIVDTAGFHAPKGDDYTVAVARENWSLHEALGSIADADARHRKSFVVVATTLGHFPWRAPDSSAHASSEAKLHRMAHTLDGAIGRFLHGVDSLGLRDSVIVVVTGDHGLRYVAEFASVGNAQRRGDVDFNVPFMAYAPGLLRHGIAIPYVTSHIDVAPTLYYLLGVPADSLMMHGDNMLDRRLATRATFLMNTGLYPVDGFELTGHRIRVNGINGLVTVTSGAGGPAGLDSAWHGDRARDLVTSANHLFDRTAAYFHQRAATGRSTAPAGSGRTE